MIKSTQSKHFVFNLAAGILTIALLGSCTKKEDTQYVNYVHEAIETNVKGFDPVISGDLYSGVVMAQIFENLFQYAYLERPVKVEPLLSDGMPTVSKDGLTYTFKIRQGIHFHDDPSFKDNGGKGREIVADDFIYSWKRLIDPKNKSDGAWIFENKVKGFNEWRDEAVKSGSADYSKPVEGFETPDKYTIKIHLLKPYPQILYVLTMVPSAVVPKEAVDFYGPDFQNHPVGSGPYKFKSWTHGAQIVLDKNPTYHDENYPSKGEPVDEANGLLADAGKKLPLNDGVIFYEVVETQPRWLNFRKGNYDWIKIPKDNFDNAVKSDQLVDDFKNQGVMLTKWIEPDTTFDSFNMDDPVVGGKNKYLRQAMSLAVNTTELIKTFYNGRAIPAQGPIPPDISGYDPHLKNPYRTYDLEKAKDLLKKAGYPDGKGLPEIVYETYSGSDIRQILEYLQQEEAKIGVKIKINMNTWPEFLEKTRARKAQMLGMAWSADYPDGENYLQLFYGPNSSPGPNNSNYNNPVYNKLYEEAAVLQDGPQRNKIYKQMVDILIEDAPWIFDVHRKAYVLSHGWIKNYKRNLILLNYIKYYRIDQEAKAALKKKL